MDIDLFVKDVTMKIKMKGIEKIKIMSILWEGKIMQRILILIE